MLTGLKDKKQRPQDLLDRAESSTPIPDSRQPIRPKPMYTFGRLDSRGPLTTVGLEAAVKAWMAGFPERGSPKQGGADPQQAWEPATPTSGSVDLSTEGNVDLNWKTDIAGFYESQPEAPTGATETAVMTKPYGQRHYDIRFDPEGGGSNHDGIKTEDHEENGPWLNPWTTNPPQTSNDIPDFEKQEGRALREKLPGRGSKDGRSPGVY